MVPRKQAGHMTCTRPRAKRQILLAMRASSTHDPKLLRARLRSQRSISVECDDQRRLLPHYVLVVLAVKQRYYYRSSFVAA